MIRPIWLGAARVVAVLLGCVLLVNVAQANVLQLVTTKFTGASPTASDTDEVFVPTSADVITNILASISQLSGPGARYAATSSAGVFGQVGLSAWTPSGLQGGKLTSEVLIASDEFVNLLGFPVSVRSNFIIDGGFIRDFFSANTIVTFTLEVGAENRGPVTQQTDRDFSELEASQAAAFGSVGGFFPGFEGGGYSATYASDATRVRTFSTTVIGGGLDLHATLDPVTQFVRIPLSLQSLDLGTMDPGDRLLLAYRAEISIEQNGVAEGIEAGFSDPFNLSSNSILGSLTFTPVIAQAPSAGTLPLLALGVLLLLHARRLGRGER